MSKKDPEDHLEDFFEEQRLQQADSYGRFSIFVWWAFGIYLFYMDGFLSFISWQAFVFFIIGTFAASGILGGIFFLIGSALAKLYSNFVNPHNSSLSSMFAVYGTAVILRVSQIAVTALAAYYSAFFLSQF